MSLSFWLRDYLYISLGGNRRGERRRQFNLMATMVLGGLWHGAAWTFVVWDPSRTGTDCAHGVDGRHVRCCQGTECAGTFNWCVWRDAEPSLKKPSSPFAWLLWDSDGTNSPVVVDWRSQGWRGYFAAQRMGRRQWWRQLPLGMYALLWEWG